MATETSASARPAGEPGLVSAVENEIPTYRAISPLAIGSLFFGLLSILCFASLGFLIAAALAVLLGTLAARKIKLQPDILTGRGYAQLGIALGLICGLSATTYTVTQDFLLRRQAVKFMQGELIPTIADGDLNGVLWYKAPPDRRRSMTPEQVRKAMDNPNATGTAYIEAQTSGAVRLIQDLKKWTGAVVEFGGIESIGREDTKPVAVALVRIRWPESHEAASGDDHDHAAPGTESRGDFAAFTLKSQQQNNSRSLSWWFDECYYPYAPESYQPKAKAVDDGHGH